jgi:hypothetical protein
MLADDVDDWHVRSARIVEIGQAIGKTRAEVKQSACRLLRHACIAVCGSGDNAFEQTENATHFCLPVECGDNMHFRGARISEADSNPSSDQRGNQTFCTVHLFISSGVVWFTCRIYPQEQVERTNTILFP